MICYLSRLVTRQIIHYVTPIITSCLTQEPVCITIHFYPQLSVYGTILTILHAVLQHYQASRIRYGARSPNPVYYYDGNRLGQILHTRLRIECSSLNDHLFHKNIVISPLCNCGQVETVEHYLLSCTRYSDTRNRHFSTFPHNITEEQLLYGIAENTDEENRSLFLAVQDYIIETKRFQ